MAYVLRTDQDLPEGDAPQSLKDGLKKANRMQDIVLANMKPGTTGNQVLQQSLQRMKNEGIEGQIYCHPIGDWGHDAGAVIGMFNHCTDWRVSKGRPKQASLTCLSMCLLLESFLSSRTHITVLNSTHIISWKSGMRPFGSVSKKMPTGTKTHDHGSLSGEGRRGFTW